MENELNASEVPAAWSILLANYPGQRVEMHLEYRKPEDGGFAWCAIYNEGSQFECSHNKSPSLAASDLIKKFTPVPKVAALAKLIAEKRDELAQLEALQEPCVTAIALSKEDAKP